MTTKVEYAKSVNTFKVIHQQPQNDYKMSKTVKCHETNYHKIYNICTKPPSEILRPQNPAKCPQTAHSPISYSNYTVVKHKIKAPGQHKCVKTYEMPSYQKNIQMNTMQ